VEVLLEHVLAAGVLGRGAQAGHRVPQRGDLVVEVRAVALLDHVVRRLLHRPLAPVGRGLRPSIVAISIAIAVGLALLVLPAGLWLGRERRRVVCARPGEGSELEPSA
jgi:hypothetical protein